jgi:hypothetical protein
MRDLLKVNMHHMNHKFNRTSDLKDLELACEVEICMADRYTYEDEQKLKNSLLTITTSDYTPNDKDKLFFLPGVSVPRIKLKTLSTERGIKTTRKIETADAIFASSATLNKLTDYTWEYVFSTENFKKFVEGAKDFFQEERDYEKLQTALEFYKEHEVIATWNAWRVMTDDDIPFHVKQGKDPYGNEYSHSERYLSIKDGKEDVCRELLKGGHATIYDESAILKHVNGENAMTIDSDVYGNLKTMFESTDTDNHILAMEIMANSNYNDSLLYLQMLFLNYSNKMDSLREKNHVNFKSLLSYLDKTPQYMSTYIDDVMDSLRDNGKMTPENVKTLLRHEAEKTLCIGGSHKYFTLKSISLTPEMLREMNYNLDFKMQDDFEPVPVAEPEVEETEIENELPQEIEEEENNPVEEVVEITGEGGFDV